MKKYLLITLLSIFLSFNPATTVKADYAQGAGVVNQLIINKQIKNNQTGQFVKNMLVTDSHFLPEQDVIFLIQVTNAGTNQLNNITFTDQLPLVNNQAFLDFVSSSEGSLDTTLQKVKLDNIHLDPGQTKTIQINTRVKPAKSLPSNQLTCLTNLAQAQFDQTTWQDSSFFCIEATVLGVTTQLPRTGPTENTLIIIGSSILILASFYFLRKSSILKLARR